MSRQYLLESEFFAESWSFNNTTKLGKVYRHSLLQLLQC